MTGTDLQILAHIPKTAGSTLVRVMQRQFRPQQVLSYENQLWAASIPEFRARVAAGIDNIRCIMGHIPFGALPPCARPVRYVTMLRDPVEWTLSVYSFIRARIDRVPNDPRYPQRAVFEPVRDMSLEQFIEFMRNNRMGDFQTRFLSGGLAREDLLPPYSPLADDAIEAARAILQAPETTFGLVEQFDRSLLLFQRRLGWRRVYYRRANVTEGRTRRVDVPAATIERIRALHARDLELYEWARQAFDLSIARLGLDRRSVAWRFQAAQAAYGVAAGGVARLRGALGR
jgi:hypothetical protein